MEPLRGPWPIGNPIRDGSLLGFELPSNRPHQQARSGSPWPRPPLKIVEDRNRLVPRLASTLVDTSPMAGAAAPHRVELPAAEAVAVMEVGAPGTAEPAAAPAAGRGSVLGGPMGEHLGPPVSMIVDAGTTDTTGMTPADSTAAHAEPIIHFHVPLGQLLQGTTTAQIPTASAVPGAEAAAAAPAAAGAEEPAAAPGARHAQSQAPAAANGAAAPAASVDLLAYQGIAALCDQQLIDQVVVPDAVTSVSRDRRGGEGISPTGPTGHHQQRQQWQQVPDAAASASTSAEQQQQQQQHQQVAQPNLHLPLQLQLQRPPPGLGVEEAVVVVAPEGQQSVMLVVPSHPHEQHAHGHHVHEQPHAHCQHARAHVRAAGHVQHEHAAATGAGGGLSLRHTGQRAFVEQPPVGYADVDDMTATAATADDATAAAAAATAAAKAGDSKVAAGAAVAAAAAAAAAVAEEGDDGAGGGDAGGVEVLPLPPELRPLSAGLQAAAAEAERVGREIAAHVQAGAVG